jgi:hypothetical protein
MIGLPDPLTQDEIGWLPNNFRGGWCFVEARARFDRQTGLISGAWVAG